MGRRAWLSGLVLGALVVHCGGAAAGGASPSPTAAKKARLREPSIPRLLGRLAAQGPRARVLVAGTVHLADLDGGLRREALAPVLAALARFRPTVVCVERLPARDIAEMDLTGGTSRQVAEMFARADLTQGRRMREVLGRSREEAAARAETLLAAETPLDDAARRELVANLIAAYEVPTALLQWSLLRPGDGREGSPLPPDVVEFLERSLASPNEVSSLAVPLARGAGLRRLVSVDSQWDGARILAQPEPALEEAFSHPLKAASTGGEIYRTQRRLLEEGKSSSLLPLFRYINSTRYGSEDAVALWSPWLRMRLASGIDRLRFANWESRNARMVANLTDVTSSTRPERVLFLVGVAHKPFVEDGLRRLVHVELTSFEELLGRE